MSAEEVLERLAQGTRVSVQAVPGAGKTRLLLLACGGGEQNLILAYNTQLAAAVQGVVAERHLESHTTVLTFHALCSRCLRLARDDAQLEAAVEEAECGALIPHDVPEVTRLLVDEAQDVRELFVRLLRVLGLLRDGMRILVVGDALQLIFDWDDEHKATLDTLQCPERMFGGVAPWHHVELNRSHRLTRPIAVLVNSLFGTDIETVRDGPPVEVRTPKSMFVLFDLLRDVLLGPERDVLLLVDRRRGNRPLRALLNAVSRRGGRRIHVHGVDADDEARCEGTLRCSTWWGAKGLEADTAIVLLPAQAPRNPTYVALTRARRRLVLVLDPRDPHAAVASALVHDLQRRGDCADIVKTEGAYVHQSLEKGCSLDSTAALERPIRSSQTPYSQQVRLRSLDRWTPERGSMATHARTTCETATSYEEESCHMAALKLTLVVAEHRAKGRVRAMENVLHPTRLDPEQFADAIRAGHAGRMVPHYATDDALLADDLRTAATCAYKRMGGADGTRGEAEDAFDSLEAAGEVALAIMAWDDFDHVMRQHRPVADWTRHPTLLRAVAIVTKSIPCAADYDVRLQRDGMYVRVHATDVNMCYHVVWAATASDEADAAVRAALHPRCVCLLIDACTGATVRVHADPELLLPLSCSSE